MIRGIHGKRMKEDKSVVKNKRFQTSYHPSPITFIVTLKKQRETM